ncbi:MAG: hypothetical protein AAFU79_32200, partial [Myxococcota bacterium]
LAALAPFRVHPHELMFYNTLAGGPELGWRYTVHGDDLGQDQNQLGEWMAREGIEEIAYAQYSARPDHFGIQHRKLPCQPTAGVAAVHVIELVRPSWSRSRCFKWLEGRRPDEKVGYTIFIYRISQAEVDALRFRAPGGRRPSRSGEMRTTSGPVGPRRSEAVARSVGSSSPLIWRCPTAPGC